MLTIFLDSMIDAVKGYVQIFLCYNTNSTAIFE